jgi:hypothetical protein
VCDLIDPIIGNWDHDLVQNLFWEEDAKIILAIPLKPNMDDFLVCHYDKKGIFSVKSAYHVPEDKMSLEAQHQEGTSSSGSHISVVDWHRLWSLPVQLKMKHFLHRLV